MMTRDLYSEALLLHTQGKTYEEIAVHMGFGDDPAKGYMEECGLRSVLDSSFWPTVHTPLGAVTDIDEHKATLDLQRAMRAHPLSEFVETNKGIGPKQGARLIAAIGDPYMKAPHIDRDTGEILEPERPRRGPAELWAYCGFAPGQKRKKGVKSNWNPQAKMRAYLIAKSVEHLPEGSAPLRVLYDNVKVAKRGMIHDAPCPQCAGKGKPPENAIGTPWKDGHIQAHALRVVAKTVLKDLYVAARDAHNEL